MPPAVRRPVLRWLSPTPSTTSSPPSPALHSLSEAMTEPLRPPPARLGPLHLRHTQRRPPPFLDNLTRSTLPTSSLSPPLPVTPPTSSHVSSPDVRRPPPIVLNQSSLTQTSLDSLRSVHRRTSVRTATRSISSTSSPSSALSVEEPTSSTAWSWWFNSESNNDALLSDEDKPANPAQKQEHIDRKYKSTKNPIVFCHGLLGFDTVSIGPSIAPLEVTHWRGIKEVLEQNGNEVLITRVPATSSPVDRAKVLEKTISEVYPGRKVHLIGHSMGGLDCRYLTTHLTQRTFTVLSVTTIATPHRGSYFADHFLHAIVGKSRLPQLLSMLDLLPNGGGSGEAFQCLTLESMKKFNEDTPNVEGVKYFSWGATYDPGLIDTWKYPHSVILEKEGPNDGLLQHVNHLDLVGWINTARYKWAEIMGKEIEFRPATFYLGIADMLAKEVEGQKENAADAERGRRSQSPELVQSDEGAEGSETRTPKQASPVDSGTATPIPYARDNKTPPDSAPQEIKDAHAQGKMLNSLDNVNKEQEGEHLRVLDSPSTHRHPHMSSNPPL
ncbi:triacylglycerol lipase [Ephemerocybe angulata]|uniref:GPI inositol-deacylase n=1 Tax=Ephemerocybe angulata TaxID=980116 RepID=A0A8H6IKS8_9AGAR|nr:triacylglycerol lipase [Tulosesus angulatus]